MGSVGNVSLGSGTDSSRAKNTRGCTSAIGTAERLAPGKIGVVAFSQEVDIGTDTYDEPRVLLRLGKLPPGLFE